MTRSISASPAPCVANPSLWRSGRVRNAITVQGPRQDTTEQLDYNCSDHGARKVKATVNRSITGRMLVTFHNLVVQSKNTPVVQDEEKQAENCDEAVGFLDRSLPQ